MHASDMNYNRVVALIEQYNNSVSNIDLKFNIHIHYLSIIYILEIRLFILNIIFYMIY